MESSSRTYCTEIRLLQGGDRRRLQGKLQSTLPQNTCSDQLQESSERVIELHDDNPWDVARLLQYIYLDRYATNDQYSSVKEMPLLDLISHDCDVLQDEARSDWDIDAGMWLLADKYDCPTLRRKVAQRAWRLYSDTGGDPVKVQEFCEEFQRLYELIEGSLHEMQDVETVLAKNLIRFKLKQHDLRSRKGVSVVVKSEHNNTVIEAFQEHVSGYMDRNGGFARKVAAGMEELVNQSLQLHKWSQKRHKELFYSVSRYQC